MSGAGEDVFGALQVFGDLRGQRLCRFELALAANQSGECRLPRNVQTVTRQGTSMLMMDPGALLAGGRWGIAEVDFFVESTNPAHLMQPATMTSPDIGRAVRRAGTLPGS